LTLSINREKEDSLKKSASIVSIITACVLTLIKMYAAFITGSLSVLSSMIDSLSDIFASLVTYIAVRYSGRPFNKNHRFGYGKAEAVSALFQAAFIAGSAIFVLYDGFYRFFYPIQIEQTVFGVIIMLVCWFITLALIIFQKYIIKLVHSQAIKADSGHYTVDLLSNGSVILSLLAVKYLHWFWFDIATAIAIAVYLLYSAWNITKDALEEITDKEINDETRQKIIKTVNDTPGVLGCHDLRSRISGSLYFIELHLELDGNLTLFEAHQISDAAEQRITSIIPHAQVIIHQDPHGLNENRLDHSLNESSFF